MTDQVTEQLGDTVDELGPVDWIVVEFPGPAPVARTATVATAAVVAHGVGRRTDRRDDRRDYRRDRRR